jgi:Flp pilus assembly pilin Flp
MRIPTFVRRGEVAPASKTQRQVRLRRRGVTSLEYVVVASLIVVVVIGAVMQLGFATDGLFSKSADATTTAITSN